jgi:MinD-like ATPase involved in chromosome partitioning or flagellar assembly
LKIKLAALDSDRKFLDRLVQTFAGKYPEKIEMYSFTDPALAIDAIKNSSIDVFLADMAFEIEVASLPSKCGFAFLVDSPDVDSIKNEKTIFKYQKAELIYKGILEIYAEKIPTTMDVKFGGDASSRVLSFISAGGGVGSSTVAAAAAGYFAQRNKKVLYLNIEEFCSTDAFFAGEGNANFSDIIFALKGNKSNLGLKIESNVRRDASGVYFFAGSSSPLDIRELSNDEISRLITNIQIAGLFDLIIVDADFDLSDKAIELLKKSIVMVFVSDGAELSNIKLKQAISALEIIEKQLDISLLARTALMYNKFSNKGGRTLTDLNIRELGGAPKYESTSAATIVAQLQKLDIFSKLLS